MSNIVKTKMFNKLLGILVVLFTYLFLVLLTEVSRKVNEAKALSKTEMFDASMKLDKGKRRKFHGKKFRKKR